MPATKAVHTSAAESRCSHLAEMDWNEIEHAGCYLNVTTGDLIRVPAEGLAAGHSPLSTISSHGETRVAKLSDNPAAPISTCPCSACRRTRTRAVISAIAPRARS